jgi:beta-lactamase class A
MRRAGLLVLLGGAALSVVCSAPPADAIAQTPPPVPRGTHFDADALDRTVAAMDARLAPGLLGVAVQRLPEGETWSHRGSQRFPMQSVFKAPLGAVVLDSDDQSAIDLDETIELTPADLSPPYSRISAAFPGRTTYTLDELLVAAAGGSDNTAADVLMRKIGGPIEVTRWLELNGVTDMRVQRYEREFQLQMNGMPAFRPEWAKEDAFLAALNAVPEETRRRATAAYLDDIRDTSTPAAAVTFLARLQAGRLLRPGPTARLLEILTQTTTGARRIKAALPPGATLAHKTGSARPAFGQNPVINDIGIVTLPDGRQFAIAIFLAATRMPYTEAEDVLAEVTRVVLAAAR